MPYNVKNVIKFHSHCRLSRSCITTCGSVLEVGLNGLEENDVSSGKVYSLESVRRLQFSPQGFPISHNNQIREIMKHI